jgi:hypothetical protein
MNSPVHRENPYQPNIESPPTAGRRANAAERRFWACHLHRLACRKCAAFAPTLPLQNPRNTRAFPSSSATAPPSARARRAAPTRGTQSGRVRARCAASRLERGAPISAHCQARQALRMALADTVAPSSSRTSCVSCQRSDSSSASSRHASGTGANISPGGGTLDGRTYRGEAISPQSRKLGRGLSKQVGSVYSFSCWAAPVVVAGTSFLASHC